MTTPAISIITASFNALPGLKETVASIASQSFRDFEHIVIDGGSTDGTPEWLATHPDIRWISESDAGIADALNKGVRMASGEWLLVLHSEDTLIQDSVLADSAAYLETKSEIVSFDVLFSTLKGDRVWKSQGLSPKLNFKTTIPHQGAFCRRSLFERLGVFDSDFQIAMDYEFFLRAYRCGARVDVVHKAFSRMPDTGVSSRRDWKSLRSRFREERLAHRRHTESTAQAVIYNVYWPPYLAYRWTRTALASWASAIRTTHPVGQGLR